MSKILVTQGYLSNGISFWLNKTNWDRDFHNSFYARVKNLFPVNESSWYSLLIELNSWKAFMFVKSEEMDIIRSNGLDVIDKMNNEIQKIKNKYSNQPYDLTNLTWAECAPLFELAQWIRNSSRPTFGSKLCNFVFPTLFPIWDSNIYDKVNTTNYQEYWTMCRDGWIECSDKPGLINILTKNIGETIIDNYPWATKISELCCLGGGVVNEQRSYSKNDITNEVTMKSQQPNFHIEVGDILVSHRGNYHYLVVKIIGEEVHLRWIERFSGEPISFYEYPRKVNINRAPTDYRIIKSIDINRNDYRTPKKGWPIRD